MAYTQADLDRVRAAKASGARSVTVDGHTMVLQSYDDLTRLEQEIARSLTRQRPSTHLVTFRRGL